jgi:phage tail P2-like protein
MADRTATGADNRIIPDGIRDASTEALNGLIDGAGTLDLTPLLVYVIDHVTATALTHLARQFHVTGYEGWLQATNETERRNLIKTAIAKHRYKGTRYAIRQPIEDLGYTCNISEWFEYGGDPYYFKVEVVTNGVEVDETRAGLIEALIVEYKNTRSWLELLSFVVGVTSPVPVYTTGYVGAETVTVYG